MSTKLIEFLAGELKNNELGPMDPAVPYNAARRFHRKYPDVVDVDGAEAVKEECLTSCDQAYCLKRGWCYGGIVYIQEINVLKNRIREDEHWGRKDLEQSNKLLLSEWKNI